MGLLTIGNLLLTFIGLGLLIFLHELGHYWMAIRQGMRVEVFSIGFGRPILSWMRKGVKWQLGWIPFGAYVRIAGMEAAETGSESASDSFCSKSIWSRAQVILMGPIANLIVAFVLFTALFLCGGRDKKFTEFSNIIGWVDQTSALYKDGLRPGDEIVSCNDRPFEKFMDLMYAANVNTGPVNIDALKINYTNNTALPIHETIEPYPYPEVGNGLKTIGIPASANFLIYQGPVQETIPAILTKGDRLLWANGHFIFSLRELYYILNDNRALLTIQRGNTYLLKRVPCLPINEYLLSYNQKQELIDWQYEAGLKGASDSTIYIPYNLTTDGVVVSALTCIEPNLQQQLFSTPFFSPVEAPLEAGDQIVAVNGHPITSTFELLQRLQQREVVLIAETEPANTLSATSLAQAKTNFAEAFHSTELQALISQVGLKMQAQQGNFKLLSPVPLIKKGELLAKEFQEYRKIAAQMGETQERDTFLSLLARQEQEWMLGAKIEDRLVSDNPNPFIAFKNAAIEPYRVLKGLITGQVNPKWLSGPVGIAQAIYQSWANNSREALYWLGVISINLGIMNLLPLPILDGGHLVFLALEKIRGKPISSKVMERIVYPCLWLLIGFAIFITFWDLQRLAHLFGG